MNISFTKVALEHGWMGNMAPFPVEYAGKTWRTTEALFQALRFEDAAIQEEIRAKTSPMGAKMLARGHRARMVVVPQGDQDLANMEMVLRLKLNQHQELKQMLLDTGDETIIEDVTRRPRGSGMFWALRLRGRSVDRGKRPRQALDEVAGRVAGGPRMPGRLKFSPEVSPSPLYRMPGHQKLCQRPLGRAFFVGTSLDLCTPGGRALLPLALTKCTNASLERTR